MEPTGQKYNSSICTLAQKPGNIFSDCKLLNIQALRDIGSMSINSPAIQPQDCGHAGSPQSYQKEAVQVPHLWALIPVCVIDSWEHVQHTSGLTC